MEATSTLTPAGQILTGTSCMHLHEDFFWPLTKKVEDARELSPSRSSPQLMTTRDAIYKQPAVLLLEACIYPTIKLCFLVSPSFPSLMKLHLLIMVMCWVRHDQVFWGSFLLCLISTLPYQHSLHLPHKLFGLKSLPQSLLIKRTQTKIPEYTLHQCFPCLANDLTDWDSLWKIWIPMPHPDLLNCDPWRLGSSLCVSCWFLSCLEI